MPANMNNLGKLKGLKGLARLIRAVQILRSPGGCPWDREQTVRSLKPFLIEETYELLEVMASASLEKHREELGDLLLQILLQAEIRREQGVFDIDDVADTLTLKLVRRHPHVFGSAHAASSGDVIRNWEEIKKSEKPRQYRSAVDGVPRHMPALIKAQRVQSRAARVGFDWRRVHDVMRKVHEEIGEIRDAMATGNRASVAREIGDLFFAVVNLSRHSKVEAEEALERATRRFMNRFRKVEKLVRARGMEMSACTLRELDAHWEDVKKLEASASRKSSRAGPSAAGTRRHRTPRQRRTTSR